MAKEQGANKLLTNCPSCILFLEQGLELMWESGEPLECGIFDFYKVFSRAFGEGVIRQRELRMEGEGVSSHASDFDSLILGQQGVCL